MCPRKLTFVLLLVLTFTLFCFAQQQPAPQTARQALIEMLTGGEKAFTKHLTVEVQQLLQKKEYQHAARAVSIYSAAAHSSGMKFFEAGPVLASINEPKENAKFEIRVDSDDLSGDQDNITLSFHSFRDGQEQVLSWSYFSSHFGIEMKRQENVWRLNRISLGAEVPVGDPKLLESYLKTLGEGGADVHATGVGIVAPTVIADAQTEQGPHDEPPEQLLGELAIAETLYARLHPEAGFTCSFSELAKSAVFGQAAAVAENPVHSGYKFSVSGCEGKPAGSFQLVAEPLGQGNHQAFCIDATQNMRVSDDGRGMTCLTAGKPRQPIAEEETVSFGPEVVLKPKK